jgi:hypothetical protein
MQTLKLKGPKGIKPFLDAFKVVLGALRAFLDALSAYSWFMFVQV